MDEKLFNELLASVQEAGSILRDEASPARSFQIDNLDVKKIRETLDLSQREFALMLSISVRTLQNWEQGRREPTGPARILLLVAEQHPDIILQTVHSSGLE
ncbi:MAG: helix-turn-helix domain-containing protein [Anaerolineae bacterium]|jgi:putative transcriptional regulator|nr:helix-turn-helix domain-containing protein [Anaerolineae bacterium]